MTATRSRPAPPSLPGDTAAAQLARMLQLIPRLSDGQPHALADLARAVGVDAATIRADLQAVIARYDVRGGFTEGFELYVEGDTVRLEMNSHFRRPMRLTEPEVTALRLGLAMLRLERPPDEHPAIDGALRRLAELTPEYRDASQKQQRRQSSAAAEGVVYGGPPLSAEATRHLTVVREAIRRRRRVRLVYRKPGDAGAESREVSPYMALRSRGRYFVLAWCEKAGELRLFRLDRVEGAEVLSVSRREVEVTLEGLDRAFLGDRGQQLTVRYSARVARWIEEREAVERLADGSVVVTYPLGDVEWAVRHVLQYGTEAEVVGPEEVRGLLMKRLETVNR